MWQERYESWRAYVGMEQSVKQALAAYTPEQAQEAFCQSLTFGTGGLRGIMGAGTNRMNVYTVDKASRGYARYLCRHAGQPSCAIAYDSRNNSEHFARVAAVSMAQLGIKVYIFTQLKPTPMLSFAVGYLGCTGGVVITASHNPAAYNGYKVYGADGCQITLNAAEEIQKYIEGESDFSECGADFEEMMSAGKIQWIDKSVEAAYFQSTLMHRIEPPMETLAVVYSALNGAGNEPVRSILNSIGNVQVTVVPEQMEPDGNFPTCPFPNPEEPGALRLAGELAKAEGADFCMATDPDCDRIGVGVPTVEGVELLNGNEMGCMLLNFICARRLEKGNMPQNPVVIKTIVSTQMANAIAKRYGLCVIEVLTGFKFIAEQIGLLEEKGERDRFLFGFEESYGYLNNPDVRDKDAVNAAMLICEMASYYKGQGKNLLQARDELYAAYGHYYERQMSFTMEGISGRAHIQRLMESFRSQGDNLFGKTILTKTDYLTMDTGLPKSDVIAFEFSDQSRVVIRPSGTEPKIKLYLSDKSKTSGERGEMVEAWANVITKWMARR